MQRTLQISKNIIPKIPQFWSSPYAAIAELIQNAYRSGATDIHIQTNPELGLLVIRDNGRGIQRLDDFLTVGNSDWEKAIVEPAGMGFYAHLGYAAQTIVFSRGTRFVFTPSCLQGAPVEIGDECDDEWTVIQVEGIDPGVLNLLDFRQMRPLPSPEADIVYLLNGEPVPNLLAKLTPLETPVGTVYLTHTTSSGRYPVGVWEGLPVGFTDSASRSHYGEKQVWAANPACGVRPQLPGREHFIRNEAYKNAQQEIADAVEAYCQQRAAALPLDQLPEAFDYRHPLSAALATFGIHEKVVIDWVEKHSYRALSTFDGSWEKDEFDSPEYPYTNGHQIRKDRVVYFSLGQDKTRVEVEEVEVLLNSQIGCWETWVLHAVENQPKVAYLYAEDAPPLELVGLHAVGEAQVAEAVKIGALTILKAPAVFVQEQPVWIGSLASILDHARELSCFWHFAEYHAEDGTWYDWIGENRDFDDNLLERSLAARYGLGEEINLRNWLKRTLESLTGWNGPPRSVIGIFTFALRAAAWLAHIRLRFSHWKTARRTDESCTTTPGPS